jgi:phosphate/phosphite/phosphonate ABC transporter binding protein
MSQRSQPALRAVAGVALVLVFSTVCLAQEIKIGVQAYKGAEQALREWKPTAEYLTGKLGRTFTVMPFTDKELITAVKDGQVDFFFSNPSIYVEMNRQANAQAIATMINLHKNQPIENVASSIFVKRDSPINRLADFKGKEFMTRAKSSFAGWLIVKRLFLEQGIDPDRDFMAVRETQSVQHVVYAVLNGVIDGGAVIAGTLEEMAEEGKVKMEDFKVINQMSDDLPLLHSTPLYPEFPIAAVSHVSPELRDSVGQALQSLNATDPAAATAKIKGWAKPLDYSSVAECLSIVQQGTVAKK